MEKKFFILLIIFVIGIFSTFVWLIVSYQQNSEEGFGIYLVHTGELVMSNEDIISYNKNSHEIKLNEEGIIKFKNLDLYKKPFVIKINGNDIYNGSFWSSISSMSFSGVVIMDVLITQHGSSDTIRIETGYPGSDFFKGSDPRNNQEILGYFQEAGKLIE